MLTNSLRQSTSSIRAAGRRFEEVFQTRLGAVFRGDRVLSGSVLNGRPPLVIALHPDEAAPNGTRSEVNAPDVREEFPER
jgi:hypothetical protein